MAKRIEQNALSLDVEEAISNGDTERLREAAEALKKVFLVIHTDIKKDPNFREQLAYQVRTTDWIDEKYTREGDIGYAVGWFRGWLEAAFTISYMDCKEEHLTEQLDALSTDIPHFQEIIFTIAQQEGVRHGKLAEQVGIEKSTLTGIMERVVESGAVIFSRPSKFKYYYLTDLGKTYCRTHQKQYDLKLDKQALLNSLIVLIRQMEEPGEFVGKIMQTIYDSKPDAHSFSEKVVPQGMESLKIIPQALNKGNIGLLLAEKDARKRYEIDRAALTQNCRTEGLDLVIQVKLEKHSTIMRNQYQGVNI